MELHFKADLIPGTQLTQEETEGLTGLAFLKKVFFVSDGIMLMQIRNISGIDSSTLQNWTKRGWVANSKLKKYDIDQVAHILIINMLRSCMQLDRIAYLIQYINGDVEDTGDDIIKDSVLYDYICRILDYMMHNDDCRMDMVKKYIRQFTSDYVEPFAGAGERLHSALEVIIVAYYAARMKNYADSLMEQLQ